MGTAKDSEITRQKLIEAAGELFAEKGFKGVTVREIVQKADTHLSALNYHFGSKDALYQETLDQACQEMALSPQDQKDLLSINPLQALIILVSESLKHYQDEAGPAWHSSLLDRESKQPSDHFKRLLKDHFKPHFQFMAHLIGKAVNAPQDSEEVQYAVLTLYAQLDTFGLYGHLIDGIAPTLFRSLAEGDFIIRQIVRTVLASAQTAGVE